jgi:hypothetical protein
VEEAKMGEEAVEAEEAEKPAETNLTPAHANKS